ncbi:carbohydrate ABC transporter permease [Paenibacillus cymbidii]|uniref:carbohydrate ABC transporter permease n=1 Tax=Paenibacillus cymbidii TaxID=1639034 RepID=UPI001F3F5C60|nr:carbohydrate ABC transporter permease [Paenibacillus cymbidii]
MAEIKMNAARVLTAGRGRRVHTGWFDIVNYAVLLLFSLLILYPFWQIVVIAFSTGKEASSLGLHVWPKVWSVSAFQFLFSYEEIVRPYVNALLRTVAGTALELLFTILAAYPLAKRELPLRGWLTTYFVIPMFFTGGLIPTYLLIRSLGLIDNFLVLILPGAVAVFSIIIMRNYFMSLDPALEESALIDGAGYFRLVFRIVVPVSVPVLATIALWAAVSHWNAWFDAMIYIRDRKLTVIQVIMREMLAAVDMSVNNAVSLNQTAELAQLSLLNVRSAIALLSIGPIVLVYPWVQRYFIKGIMLGSMKG